MSGSVLHENQGQCPREVARCLDYFQDGRGRENYGADRHEDAAAFDAIVDPDTAVAGTFEPRGGGEEFGRAECIEQLAHDSHFPNLIVRGNRCTALRRLPDIYFRSNSHDCSAAIHHSLRADGAAA